MKNLTYDEFQNRLQAFNRARKVFIESGLTKNISHAFEAYQEILADEHRSLTITGKPRTMPEGIRVRCKICGKGMGLGPVNTMPGDQIGGDWKSQWYCTNCDESIFNMETVQEIMQSGRK